MNSETNLIQQIEESIQEGLFNDLSLSLPLYQVLNDKGMSDQSVDLELKVTVNHKIETIFAVEVKKNQTKTETRDSIRRVKGYARAQQGIYPIIPFIAGNFLSEGDRVIAKEEGVGYFDLAGNFYLNYKNIYIEKIVNKNPFSKKIDQLDLFSPVASRISRVLLVNNTRSWKLIELSAEAQVSLGMTHRIIERMMREEIVIRNKDKKYSIKNPAYLVSLWRNVYPMYHQKKIGFYGYKSRLDLYASIDSISSKYNLKYALSYSSGASFIAPFVISGIEKAEIYIENPGLITTWKDKLELVPVEKGANVELYVPYDSGVFYGMQTIPYNGIFDTPSSINIVNNIQLYLDLYNSPARGKEQAEHLRELKFSF